MKKRSSRVIFGIALILIGALLLYLGSARVVNVVVDGTVHTVTTRAVRVSDVLRDAGVALTASDRVRPGLSERTNGLITLDHAVNVTLRSAAFSEPLNYTSYQHLGGNILLDAGIRLYPGDRLLWQGTELRPDFNLAGVTALELEVRSADVFTLRSEDAPNGRTAYGSGATVYDALLSAGVNLNKSYAVVPDGDTPFVSGMTIEVLPLRELTVARNGSLTQVVTYGANVGEALARAGIPLMGSDISIPAASEALPEDGRVLIVPVSDRFSMSAEKVYRGTDWIANDSLDLDSTNLLSEGRDGLRGTFTRVRTENGVQVLNETSEENELVKAVNDQREYGTKITIRTLDTPDGTIEYYRALSVYATSYSPCRSGTSSCINGTASGKKVEKGVIAVTSDWYSKFGGDAVYIPDYGTAVIGDVGGGISGKHWIDLAYSDDDFVSWSKETTIYFLTPLPADMIWVLQ